LFNGIGVAKAGLIDGTFSDGRGGSEHRGTRVIGRCCDIVGSPVIVRRSTFRVASCAK
jgi:hypothetical protein